MDKEDIQFKYCTTERLVANILIKAFAKDRHQRLTNAMDIIDFDYL